MAEKITIVERIVSATPLTDMIENETLAEYRYCERAFNCMAEHARDLEEKLIAARAALDQSKKKPAPGIPSTG